MALKETLPRAGRKRQVVVPPAMLSIVPAVVKDLAAGGVHREAAVERHRAVETDLGVRGGHRQECWRVGPASKKMPPVGRRECRAADVDLAGRVHEGHGPQVAGHRAMPAEPHAAVGLRHRDWPRAWLWPRLALKETLAGGGRKRQVVVAARDAVDRAAWW